MSDEEKVSVTLTVIESFPKSKSQVNRKRGKTNRLRTRICIPVKSILEITRRNNAIHCFRIIHYEHQFFATTTSVCVHED